MQIFAVIWHYALLTSYVFESRAKMRQFIATGSTAIYIGIFW